MWTCLIRSFVYKFYFIKDAYYQKDESFHIPDANSAGSIIRTSSLPKAAL